MIRWFRMQRLLDVAAAADMLAWKNSGFSIDASVRITLNRPGRADWDTVCAGTRKTPPRREKAGGRAKAWCSPGRQQHATHEPLISRAMREEVPLAGPSSGGRCKRDGSSGRTAASALPRCLRHPKTRPVQCGSAACRASGMQSACWLLHPPGFSSGTITGQPGNSWGMPATSVTNRG